MKYLISVLAVISAPLIYGFVCVPAVSALTAANAGLLNDMGGTENVGLIVQIELVQAIVLLAIGFIVAWIARDKEIIHVFAATALMLAIGISVQVSFWEAMPVWHHFVFFGLILFLVPAGGYLNEKIMGSGETVTADEGGQ